MECFCVLFKNFPPTQVKLRGIGLFSRMPRNPRFSRMHTQWSEMGLGFGIQGSGFRNMKLKKEMTMLGRVEKLKLLQSTVETGARLSGIAEKCVSQIGSWTQEVGCRGPDEACMRF